MHRNARLAKRPPISFAFVDIQLPNGVVTIVRLDQPDSLRRYAIVSKSHFDNSVLMFAHCGARWFESQREDDNSPATIMVYADGYTEATSQQLAETILRTRIHQAALNARMQQVGGSDMSRQIGGPNKSRHAARMLKRVSTAPGHDIPGFGIARVLQR